MRKVGIGAGPHWLRDAVRMVVAHPGPFLIMGLIFTVLPMIPLLGIMIMLLLGPALMGGMVYAARRADQRNTPQIGDLFRAFQQGDRIGSFIALCLPMVGAAIVMVILVIPFVSSSVHSGAITRQTLDDPQAMRTAVMQVIHAMPDQFMMFAVGSFIALLLAAMMSFFSAALVMLERMTAFAAIKASFMACTRNFGAFFVAVLLLGFGIQLLRLVLGLAIGDFLAAVIANIPYYALLGPLTYIGYRAIFDPPETPADDGESRPPPPPPPQHTFEA